MVIVRALAQALREYGHEAEIVTTPSLPFGAQAREYFLTWRTNVRQIGGRPVDRVISTRFPSYAVRHPSHVCWLNHTMREYYDLWDDFSGRLSRQGRMKERVRRGLIHAADSHFFFWHVKKMFAQSRTIQGRLRRWNRTQSEVLYPPAPPRPYRCEAYEPFLFVVSRLAPLKRIDLILDALATPAAAGVRCVIAGEGESASSLQNRVVQLGLEGRVSFLGRISDADLVDHLGRCRAVAFVPKQEDYGFVTAEAFASAKPVITTTDSGGPAELVIDGLNGLLAPPEAEPLGIAIAQLMEDPARAETLGRAAASSAAALRWSDVAATLSAPL